MRVTVMVVEDNEPLRHLLGTTLRTSGLNPVLVSDAETALRRLAREHPDVILCDVELPGMNGDRLSEVIKSSELASIPVVLMSAIEPNQHTADAFIAKPFDPFEVVDLIEDVNARAAWRSLFPVPQENPQHS